MCRESAPVIYFYLNACSERWQEDRRAVSVQLAAMNPSSVEIRFMDTFQSGPPSRSQFDTSRGGLFILLFWDLLDPVGEEWQKIATESGIEQHLYFREMPVAEQSADLTDFLKSIKIYRWKVIRFNEASVLVQNLQQVVEAWLNRRQLGTNHILNSMLIEDSGKIPARPMLLIGRDDVLAQVEAQLDLGERILLHGSSGTGKTAIVASLAARRLETCKQKQVLWVTIGLDANLRDVVNSIATAISYKDGKIAATINEDEAIRLVNERLATTRPLVVLDDCWDSSLLAALITQVLPVGVPAIITSRVTQPIKTVFDLNNLDRLDAVKVLIYYANTGVDVGEPTLELCDQLSGHPYSLEIAGRWMMMNGVLPQDISNRIKRSSEDEVAELLARHEANSKDTASSEINLPTTLLLDATLEALDEPTRRAFWLLGSIFKPQITPELLADLIRMNEPQPLPSPPKEKTSQANAAPLSPEISAAIEAAARKLLESLPKTPPGEWLRNRKEIPLSTPEEIAQAECYLQNLAKRSLVQYVNPGKGRIGYYRFHDLTYAYLRAHNAGDREMGALALAAYARHHSYAEPEHNDAIEAELPNILCIPDYYKKINRFQQVNGLAHTLTHMCDFLHRRGYYLEAIHLLSDGIYAARALEERGDELLHWMHLSTVYRDLGRYPEAIHAIEQSLRLARNLASYRCEAEFMAMLANIYTLQGRFAESETLLAEQKKLIDQKDLGKEIDGCGMDQTKGFLLHRQGRYIEAAELFRRAVEDARQKNNEHDLAAALTNLGATLMQLGQLDEALKSHEEALEISRRIGDRLNESQNIGDMGLVYQRKRLYEKAISHYTQALDICRSLGHRDNESIWMSNLSGAYNLIGKSRIYLPRCY